MFFIFAAFIQILLKIWRSIEIINIAEQQELFLMRDERCEMEIFFSCFFSFANNFCIIIYYYIIVNIIIIVIIITMNRMLEYNYANFILFR